MYVPRAVDLNVDTVRSVNQVDLKHQDDSCQQTPDVSEEAVGSSVQPDEVSVQDHQAGHGRQHRQAGEPAGLQ